MAITPRRLLLAFVLLVSLSYLLIVYLPSLHEASWIAWAQQYPLPPLELDANGRPPKIEYVPGTPNPAGQNYTKTLVMPRTKAEDTRWLDHIPPDISRAVYVVDDPRAPLHPPKNKGHEVMVYLTYIIEHYDALPDVSIFMHSHQRAWHNSEFFDLDAAAMLRHLNPARVVRHGFMNLRCQWFPGCPDWLHPHETAENSEKTEEVLIARAWAELFPFDPVPAALGTPCCAQFAVSRARIRALPRPMYVRYRDWLLHTPLRDFASGRVWEYVWQFVFTGQAEFCPAEVACHCDGYGVCFADDAEYRSWYDLREERNSVNDRWLEWEEQGRQVDAALEAGRDPDAMHLERPTPGMADVYAGKIAEKQALMDQILGRAFARGEDPGIRAQYADLQGEGDGW